MVLSFEESKEFENLKQENKKEIAEISHKNSMEELELQLEIAKANGNSK